MSNKPTTEKMKLIKFSFDIKLIMFLLLMAVGTVNSQTTLNKPEPAPNANLGSVSPWTAACASASFNEYFVNFTWGAPLVNSDNTFILELSDATGNFDTPVQLASDDTKNTNFGFDFIFALPTDTRGNGYKFRVRSTSPALTSPESDAFQMYYIDYDSPVLISKDGNGTIPPGGSIEICDGDTITLAPHNVSNAGTYQYNWYRSSTLLSEKGPSLTTSQAGMYNVEIDYGVECSGSANTLSNTIEITLGTRLDITINTPTKTALCSGETETLQASVSGLGHMYTWYKDNVAITTPTVDDDSYTIDASIVGFEGNYAVEISGTGVCLEQSAPITITNAGDFTITLGNSPNLVLLPSTTETLSVTSTASSPIYQWYKDGGAIVGETTSTLNIITTGIYHATVTQSGGACTSTTKNSEQTTVVAPTSFELVTDYATTYTSCENTSIALEVITINAVAADNSKTDVTTILLASLVYQWKKDGVAVSGETTNTISLTGISENGNYVLDATIDAFTLQSNTVPVQLLVNETLTIQGDGTVNCDPSNTINIDTTTDLSAATFEWFKDGISISTTDIAIVVNSPGTYRLVLDRGGCPLRSNEFVISPLDESLITLDTDENLVVPEGGSRIVRASGGTSYSWLDSNNIEISNTDSATFTEEGTYNLIANIVNCQIVRQLTVTFLDTFKVPNVITVNGDGINDQWIIPNSYSNDSEINIIIHNKQGKEVLNITNYANNWPQSSMSFPKQNMVFYYTIRNAQEILKQGTITVIR